MAVPQLGVLVVNSRSHRTASRLIERAMVDRRTAAKLIRFHPEELEQIVERARRAGLTPARFIRETALGAAPRARSYAVDQPLLNELARIGRSLDQIAHRALAAQDPALAAETSAALEHHQALIRHIVPGRRQKGGSPS